ncbi:hypothetical protein [Frankia sp. AgKG'84/4]|uniref:hypothetical protein n=1 Tax=Frankia sp. AgKG'84/4 TaxID=573490 RepID=UPI00200D042D|nr:hypothetical protein [Frankia sp. AgKG'84/4]MCL9795597.1 hypothetical protein [Frankia sp. AgKG'84/4]
MPRTPDTPPAQEQVDHPTPREAAGAIDGYRHATQAFIDLYGPSTEKLLAELGVARARVEGAHREAGAFQDNYDRVDSHIREQPLASPPLDRRLVFGIYLLLAAADFATLHGVFLASDIDQISSWTLPAAFTIAVVAVVAFLVKQWLAAAETEQQMRKDKRRLVVGVSIIAVPALVMLAIGFAAKSGADTVDGEPPPFSSWLMFGSLIALQSALSAAFASYQQKFAAPEYRAAKRELDAARRELHDAYRSFESATGRVNKITNQLLTRQWRAAHRADAGYLAGDRAIVRSTTRLAGRGRRSESAARRGAGVLHSLPVPRASDPRPAPDPYNRLNEVLGGWNAPALASPQAALRALGSTRSEAVGIIRSELDRMMHAHGPQPSLERLAQAVTGARQELDRLAASPATDTAATKALLDRLAAAEDLADLPLGVDGDTTADALASIRRQVARIERAA